MTFNEFFKNNKTIIVVILLLIIAFIIYRYYLQQINIRKSLHIAGIERKLSNLESDIGITPTFTSVTPISLSPSAPSIQPLSPSIQPLSPSIQPLSPSIQPLSPSIQPLSPSPLSIQPSPTPFIHGETLHKVCLDQVTQKRITDEISKKLNEINMCDCRQTCAAMFNSQNNQLPISS